MSILSANVHFISAASTPLWVVTLVLSEEGKMNTSCDFVFTEEQIKFLNALKRVGVISEPQV